MGLVGLYVNLVIGYSTHCHTNTIRPFIFFSGHLQPGRPSNVTLTVSGRCSLYVAFNAPLSTLESNDVTTTRYCGKIIITIILL